MCQPINGVPEFDRPVVDITVTMSYWDMIATVNTALKKAGLNQAAAEFRKLKDECDNDEGMLFSLALLFVRLPGQEPTT